MSDLSKLAAREWARAHASQSCDPVEFGRKVALVYCACEKTQYHAGDEKAYFMAKKSGIAMALGKFDGSPSKLAKAIGSGVLRQHVEHWVKANRVPAEKAPDVELATGIPCEKLCPDVNWSVLRKATELNTSEA